jgi:hypothetical protein
MQQILPWENKNLNWSKNFHWNTELHNHAHKIQTSHPILSQHYLFQNLIPNSIKFHFNIIHQPMLMPHNHSHPLKFLNQTLHVFLFLIIATWLSHRIVYSIILIILCEECVLWISSICSFLHPSFTFSIYGINIPLSTLFSKYLRTINIIDINVLAVTMQISFRYIL